MTPGRRSTRGELPFKHKTYDKARSHSQRRDRAQCLVSQYSGLDLGEQTVSGDQTLGENIADSTGLKLAYGAYGDWLSN